MFAGYHYDLNVMTIHGKSRFPGLFIWLRDGTRVPVKVPDGCLLLQAGKQVRTDLPLSESPVGRMRLAGTLSEVFFIAWSLHP